MSTAHDESAWLLFAEEPAEVQPAGSLTEQIDAMSYEDLLRLVRNAPLSHPLFRGEVGKHFHATLRTKRHALTDDERAATSKKVGF